MRIGLITAGAAGMFCGSCMRDNALVNALLELGHDATLIPTYTPIRTDDENVSEKRVFYGGINVYLQEKSGLFRIAPRFIDWLLNRPMLLRWVSRFAQSGNYAEFGDLTVSMLQGSHGHQRKELSKLIDWLRDELKPEVVILTNVLLSGIAPEVKTSLQVPVLATLQGDDIFLDSLHERDRQRCLEQIRANDASIDGYISTSCAYADSMATYLGVDRAKIHIVYPGLNLKGHGRIEPIESRPPTIGYFARICPEKGFHNLVDAFIHLRKNSMIANARLRFSGWLGEFNQPYLNQQLAKLKNAGLADAVDHVECPDHASKVGFLNSIDVLSVPTVYHEPKGLYVLEAWANHVPVVLPRHGAFPELVEAANGGLLYEPGNIENHAEKLEELLRNPVLCQELARNGLATLHQRFTAQVMAKETILVLNNYVTSSLVANV
jgi:glycosyltransferase involved in cell wall biosynthesis